MGDVKKIVITSLDETIAQIDTQMMKMYIF